MAKPPSPESEMKLPLAAKDCGLSKDTITFVSGLYTYGVWLQLSNLYAMPCAAVPLSVRNPSSTRPQKSKMPDEGFQAYGGGQGEVLRRGL